MAWSDSEYLGEQFSGEAKKTIFSDIVDAFYVKFDNSPEMLDELLFALHESPELRSLQVKLDEEHPQFTSIYRYDPQSIHILPGDQCFRDEASLGAQTAYGHIFQDLTSEKIHILRTLDEALVVIDQPSYVMLHGENSRIDTEPTVLFSSKQLERTNIWQPQTGEIYQFGLEITHGNNPTDIFPDSQLLSAGMQSKYLNYSFEYRNAIKEIKKS